MREISITDFSRYNAKYGTVRRISWDDFAAELSTHKQIGSPEDTYDQKTLNAQKGHRCFVAGPVDDTWMRRNENVLGWDVLCADVDNATDEQMDKVAAFHERFASVLYTTHKSGAKCLPPEERYRVRLVVLMDQTIPPLRTLEAWNRLNLVLGNAIDRQTKNIGRVHYYPSSFDTSDEDYCWASVSDSKRPLSLNDLPPLSKTGDLKLANATTRQVEAVAKITNRTQRLSKDDPHKPLLTAFLRGDRLANEGKRHDAILQLTARIASWCPDLEEELLEQLSAGTLEAHSVDEDPIQFVEIWNAYKGAADFLSRPEHERRATLNKEQLQEIADVNGWDVADIPKRTIIMHEESFFFLTEEGDFDGPYSMRPASVLVMNALEKFPVDLYTPTQNGYTKRSFLDICQDHTWVARNLVSDLRTTRTHIDIKTQTIHEATAVRRISEPQYDKQIAEYLYLLSGDRYEKFQDWLSFLYQLDKRLCALLVWGESGSGKTFLANAVSYMYGGAPTNGREVLAGKFGDTLAQRPIVFADEKLEGDRAYQDMTARVREFLGTEERMVQRKGRSTVPLFGNPRLILAANNTSILESKFSMTRDDIKAQAVRFFAIHASDESKRYLESIPEKVRKNWKEHGVVQHVLWLEANREVKNPGKRFAVDGDTLELAQELSFSNNWIALVTQAIAKALLHPGFVKNNAPGINGEIVARKGNLFVRVEGVTAAWEYIRENTRDVPERAEIKKVLRNFFSVSQKAEQLHWNGSTKSFYRVDVEEFLGSANNLDFDVEELRKVLATDSRPLGG